MKKNKFLCLALSLLTVLGAVLSFPGTAQAAYTFSDWNDLTESNELGIFHFSKTPAVGTSFVIGSTNTYCPFIDPSTGSAYTDADGERGYIPLTISTGTIADFADITYRLLRGTGLSDAEMAGWYSPSVWLDWQCIVNSGTYTAGDGSTVTVHDGTILLNCSHAGVTANFTPDPSLENADPLGPVTSGLYCTVLSLSSDGRHMLVGVISPTSNGQAGTSFFRVKYEVEPTYATARVRKVSEDGRISGIRFRLSGDGYDETSVTNASGIATFTDVPAGTYTLSELSVDGAHYNDPGTATVTVTPEQAAAGETVSVSFANSLKKGELLVSKSISTNPDAALSGFTFHLTGTSDTGIDINLTAITNDQGIARFSNVPYGTYTLAEELSAAQAGIFKVSSPQTVSVNAADIYAAVDNKEDIKPLVVLKTSEDTALSGFHFEVTGTRASGGQISLSGETDEEGRIDFGEIPPGTYVLTELLTETQKSRYREPVSISFTVSAGSTSPIVIRAENKLLRGGISLKKQDIETGSVPQGDGTLAGIRFAIINRNSYAVSAEDGTSCPAGSVVFVLTTDEAGSALSSPNALPLGLYEITELRMDDTAQPGAPLLQGSSPYASRFYEYSAASQTVEIKASGEIVSAPSSFQNAAARAFIHIQKEDADSGSEAQAGSFSGIRFAVINQSANAVVMNGILVKAGTVAAVLAADAGGGALTEGLPLGTYLVRELRLDDVALPGETIQEGRSVYANGSYLWTDQRFSVVLTEAGQTVTAQSEDGLPFRDEVIRGGFYFEKKIRAANRRLPYAPFMLTNLETGETHYFILDRNGYFSTERAAHSYHTNGADSLLAEYSDGAIIPQDIMEQLIAERAYEWGVWFGAGEARDNVYALPAGEYELTELRFSGNEEMAMISDRIIIWKNGQRDSLGTLYNDPRLPEESTPAPEQTTEAETTTEPATEPESTPAETTVPEETTPSAPSEGSSSVPPETTVPPEPSVPEDTAPPAESPEEPPRTGDTGLILVWASFLLTGLAILLLRRSKRTQ